MINKSEKYKINAVEYYLDSNKTQKEACNILKYSVRRLVRWAKRYEDKNSIKTHNRKTISYKVKKEHVNLH